MNSVTHFARRLAAIVFGLAAWAALPAAAIEQSLVQLTATPRYAAPGQPIQLGATVYFENLIFVPGPWFNPFPGTATFYANGSPIDGCTAIAFPNDLTPWDVTCSYTPPSSGEIEFQATYSGGGDYTPGASPYVPATVAVDAPATSPIPFEVNYTASTFGAMVTSRPVALSGFTGTRSITVSGGQYAIGCAPPWRTDAGTVSPGDVLCVRHVTPSIGGWATTTRVTIGAIESSFQSVTEYPDPSNWGQETTIAAGISHTIAYSNNAGILVWGDNTGGKLGIGNTANTSVPAINAFVSGPLVAAGLEHSLVGSNGFVTAMGLGTDGQLGGPAVHQCTVTGEPGTFACSRTPETAAGPMDPVALGAGWRHSLALTQDGSVWAWGSGVYGQNGKLAVQPTPERVAGLPAAAVRIAAGYMHSVALLEDGRVAAWGSNQFGELGPGVPVDDGKHPTPVIIPGLTDVVDIAAGGSFTLALKSDGTVWSWGANIYGQLGDPVFATTSGGLSAYRAQPTQIPGLSGIRQVAAGFGFAFARTTGGTVYGWGYNQDGQVNGVVPTGGSNCGVTIAGVIEPRCVRTPSVVPFSNIVAMYPGGAHTILLRSDGTLRTIGNNAAGQLAQPVPAGTQPGQAVKFVREMYDPNTFLNPAGVGGTPATVGRASAGGGLDLDDVSGGIDFGPVPQGQASAPVRLRLSNLSASTAIAVGPINVTSSLPGEFGFDSFCPASLDAGASCEMDVTFTPADQSDRDGRLDISVSATDTGTISMALRGTGIDPRPVPAVTLQAPGGTTAQQGTPFTIEATVTGPVAATGTVGFSLLSSGPIAGCGAIPVQAGTGKAPCTSSSLPEGNQSVIAYYSGNAELQPANSASFPIFVMPAPTFALTVTKAGAGTVVSSPAGIGCGATCNANFASGTVVTLTATADAGSGFAGWSGACSNATGACVVTMDAAKSVNATFLLTQAIAFGPLGNKVLGSAPFTVSATGGGSNNPVTFASTTQAICTVTGNTVTPVAAGTCTLTASQAGNASYLDATPVSQSFTVLPAGSLAITSANAATFTIASAGSFTVTATGSPAPTLSVTGALPSGVTFTPATGVLAGTPAAGSAGSYPLTFTASNGVAANATQSFTLTVAKIAQAISFGALGNKVLGDAPFAVNATGGASGNAVTFGSATSSTCTVAGNTVTLVAAGTCTITASQAGNASYSDAAPVSQSFSIGQGGVTLTVTLAGAGGGTVTSSPAGINCGTSCSAAFVTGTSVTLTATPASDSVFDGWSGACTGKAGCTVPMGAAAAVTATFIRTTAIPRLGNLSTRMAVGTGDNVLIGGLVIGGTQPKRVVIRARGPSLTPLNVPGAMANPHIALYAGQTLLDSNDNWQASPDAAAIQATGFEPLHPDEAAVIRTLTPGGYTAIVSGVGGTTGVALVEAFEVDLPQVPLINIATRGFVSAGDNVMIGGFVILGASPQTVIIRARGPSLGPLGVPNTLPDPVLRLYDGANTLLRENDDWQASPDAAQIQSLGFAPTDAKEAAIRVTLPPGAYTAIVSGANGATGIAIVEVFAQ